MSNTKNKFDSKITVVLVLVVVILIGVIGLKSSLSFDASYNLLSYQSLFNGEGFKYSYGTHDVYFDPVISTGPELYLPTFVLWKIVGDTSYESAILVFTFYCAALLFLLFFIFLRDFKYKSVALLFFIFLIVTNNNIFDNNILGSPLGEVVSVFFIIAGFYSLYKNKYILGPLLLGFAFNVKTNIIIALAPTMFLFYLLEYYITFFKQKKYKKIVRVSLAGFLVFVPYLIYNIILPKIVLNSSQYESLLIEKQLRATHVLSRGFGQLITLKGNFNLDGMKAFAQTTIDKFSILSQFMHINYILLILFAVAFGYLIVVSYKNKILSFYLFIFSGFILLWWLFATVDPWYRYFVIIDLLIAIGLTLMLPYLFEQYHKNKIFVIIFCIVVVMLSSRLSIVSMQNIFVDNSKQQMIEMSQYINNIEENDIFTYGWFQAPQLMFLTNKRFGDILTDNISENKKQYAKNTKDNKSF